MNIDLIKSSLFFRPSKTRDGAEDDGITKATGKCRSNEQKPAWCLGLKMSKMKSLSQVHTNRQNCNESYHKISTKVVQPKSREIEKMFPQCALRNPIDHKSISQFCENKVA